MPLTDNALRRAVRNRTVVSIGRRSSLEDDYESAALAVHREFARDWPTASPVLALATLLRFPEDIKDPFTRRTSWDSMS